MNINTAVSNATTLRELRILAEQADIKLSFFGQSYIVLNGYEGSLPLDALASRVMKMIENRPNLIEDDRINGRALENRINLLYERSDELLDECNCFKKITAGLIGCISAVFDYFVLKSFPIRSQWDGPLYTGSYRFTERVATTTYL